jgi:small subunit ribosomal protein S20
LTSPPDDISVHDERGFLWQTSRARSSATSNIVARDRNKAVKSELRTRVKNAVTAVGTEDEETALRTAIKRIDKAATKKVIHKNQAANKKSGLMKRIAALKQEA